MPVTVSHLFKDPSTVTCMYDSRLMYHNFPTAPLTSSPPPECSVCDPAKIFLKSKISYLLFFSNPTHKTKTGTAKRWETISSNPHSPIKLSNQSINQSINNRCYALLCLLLASACGKMLGQNHFAEPNPHVLTFLLPIFFCRAELGLQEKEETKLK